MGRFANFIGEGICLNNWGLGACTMLIYFMEKHKNSIKVFCLIF